MRIAVWSLHKEKIMSSLRLWKYIPACLVLITSACVAQEQADEGSAEPSGGKGDSADVTVLAMSGMFSVPSGNGPVPFSYLLTECPNSSKAWLTTKPLSSLGTPDDMVLQQIDPHVRCPCTAFAGIDASQFGYKLVYEAYGASAEIYQWRRGVWIAEVAVSANFADVKVTPELKTACQRAALQVPSIEDPI